MVKRRHTGHGYRTRLYILAFVAVMAVLAESSCAPSGSGPPSSSRHGPSTSAADWGGVYAGNSGPPGVRAFERYVGQPVTHVTLFLDTRRWEYTEYPQRYGLQRYEHQPYQLVLSVPMLPSESGDTLKEGAQGLLDQHFSILARNLVAMGMSNVIIRLGWELSGTWFLWSARSDPAAYAAYWRHAVDAMRSVPGGHFSFDWNGGGVGPSGWDPAAAYPGDHYVDYVTIDLYDVAQSYERNDPSPAQVQAWWTDMALNGPYALSWTARFAAAHGKKFAIPEWGLMRRPDGKGGGDDPAFLTYMYDFAVTHDPSYVDYFAHDLGTGSHSDLTDGSFPMSYRLYPRLFGVSTLSGSTPSSRSTIATDGELTHGLGYTRREDDLLEFLGELRADRH